jgi:tetratricopeptide (TPR) repeat protein
MATLGRVYLAQNKLDEAIKWFDAATTRNPQLGEAHYYKAVAYLMRQPPDATQAVSAARAARNAGYPNAEALLREAEGKARGE